MWYALSFLQQKQHKKVVTCKIILKTSGLFDRLVKDAPFHYTSPNDPEVRDVVGTVVLAIICGFTRYVHINRLRNDVVLPMLLGLRKIVSEDSVRLASGSPLPKSGEVLVSLQEYHFSSATRS